MSFNIYRSGPGGWTPRNSSGFTRAERDGKIQPTHGDRKIFKLVLLMFVTAGLIAWRLM